MRTALSSLASLSALALLGPAATRVPAQTGWSTWGPLPHPSSRGYHALAFDFVRATTVLFGGWDFSPLPDTWEWDGSRWTQRFPAQPPSPRCCHAMTYDLGRNRVVLFGGTDGGTADLGDTWEYDGTNWVQALPAHSPAPRRMPRIANDLLGSGCLLFGGGRGGNGAPFFGDTWRWDGNDWTQLAPATSPSARWSYLMAGDLARLRIVMFGGTDSSGLLTDTWTWNGGTWTALPTTPSPPAAWGSGLAYDMNRDLMVLISESSGVVATWLLVDDSWRADPRPFAPSTRRFSALAHDVVRGRTVAFGGWNGNPMADTWEYDAGVIARWSAFGAGCAGTFGVPALAPVASSRPVLGGAFALRLGQLPSGVAAISIGFSNLMWGGRGLPFALGALGMPGCWLYAGPDVMSFAPVTAGVATVTWSIPANASLAGIRFFDQGFAVDAGANALGVVVSNAGDGIVGPF